MEQMLLWKDKWCYKKNKRSYEWNQGHYESNKSTSIRSPDNRKREGSDMVREHPVPPGVLVLVNYDQLAPQNEDQLAPATVGHVDVADIFCSQ